MYLSNKNKNPKNYNPRRLPPDVLEDFQMPRILVIEDDRTMRRLIRSTLGDQCHLSLAANANLGVRLFRNIHPHIVFLDIVLPDGNGHNLLDWMMSVNPESFIVMMSGYSDNNNVFRAINRGAKGFISKPFDQDKMDFFIQESMKPSMH